MKKILSSLTLVSLLTLPAIALAQQPGGGLSLEGMLISAGNALWGVFVALAIVMFIWAAILFISAAGDPDRVAKARQALVYGVIGIIVAVLAFSIINIVRTIMGV